jgi:tRNA A37 methylthiotransferase MiaB
MQKKSFSRKLILVFIKKIWKFSPILSKRETRNAILEIRRIRLSHRELKAIPDAVSSQIASDDNKLIKRLHFPIQSCSDNILQMTQRNYTITEVRNYLE